MSQLPGDRESSSGYIMDVDNVAEMARLTRLARHLTAGLDLLPPGLHLPEDAHILDVGCGPGEWILEMARRFPTARLKGIDVSQSAIAYARFSAQMERVTNAQFTQADARQPLPFPAATFDLIHARLTGSWLTTDLWPEVMREYHRLLKPGGRLCNIEYENLGITSSPALTRFNALSIEAMRRAGQCFSPDSDHSGLTVMLPWLQEQAGFKRVQIEARAVRYSFGTLGYTAMVENLVIGLKLIQPFLMRQGVAVQEELDMLYEQAVQEMRSEDFQALIYYLRVCGER
jgi:ubiquinone/menaquinone biosynthesis C-methylase UbiE